MSVLNKYNQRVIAILGTITIVALAAVIIISSIFMIEEFIDTRGNEPYESGITVDNVQKGDSILRDQAISLKMPVRLDSAWELYVIPVGQANLEYPGYVLGVMNSTQAIAEWGGYHDLNNLLVYDAASNESLRLFNEKTSIDRFKAIKYNESPYIVISAAQRDTDKNGRLNDADFLTLFVYDVLNRKMHSFEKPGRGLIEIERFYATSKLIAQYGIDQNGNGNINHYREPQTQMIIDLLDFSARDIISDSDIYELQRIID